MTNRSAKDLRTIGLLGGMSWESTREYYRLMNEGVRAACGGLHSAPLLLHSFDFARIAEKQHQGEWDALGDDLASAAQGLERAGAEAIVVCTNLMHKVAPAIEAKISVPLLHIADAVGQKARADGVHTVALLGTVYTMREAFYRDRLMRHGLHVRIPEADDADEISRVIYEELCQGRVTDSARRFYGDAIARLKAQGAEGVVLGCTEIMLLLCESDSSLPLYDSTRLHAEAALAFMLGAKRAEKAA